ncbi:MAG: DUF262 domain-containing protein [Bacteroidales bacterium]|jgi:uncharacterized protein with ParB-like and HNH nuclease domain|nr:DUF262 domain-containing protein [Bacteroidales bacterium]
MDDATITMREYIKKGKTFVIPKYQRGYVWGKSKKGSDVDSVTYMLKDTLIPGFNTDSDIFIQGITVSENNEHIVLIDGQQRTILFYLMLKYLGYNNNNDFKISYKIREESNKFLENLDLSQIDENDHEDFQDIYYFKKTLRIISTQLNGFNTDKKSKFLNYLLDKVKFLYINIPEDKATKVFSMMNGNKAEMKSEELIKAELLRLASLNCDDFEKKEDNEKHAIEWDNNVLRGRYAREWDKWLQWWNREDVKAFFKVDNAMGLLISTYQSWRNDVLTFNSFKHKFFNLQKPACAKKTFDGLRRLQKRFEDTFNNPITYNLTGAIMRVIGNDDINNFIKWYFFGDKTSSTDIYSIGTKVTDEKLRQYYKYSFLGLSHKMIIDNCNDKFDEKFEEIYQILESNNLYNENAEQAFRLLLRLNIDEDNLQDEGKGRPFDFSIWDRKDSRGRSLEHIYPKSKVYHEEKQNDGKNKYFDGNEVELPQNIITGPSYLSRSDCTCNINDKVITASEHSIGNLVLLYMDDNSSFKNCSFDDKKSMFFKYPQYDKNGNIVDKRIKEIFKSRQMLHTIYKFANSSWDGKSIAMNKYETLVKFKTYYGK